MSVTHVDFARRVVLPDPPAVPACQECPALRAEIERLQAENVTLARVTSVQAESVRLANAWIAFVFSFAWTRWLR